jgi:hypothetical protein
MKVRDVYDEVANVLLEPAGLTLGLLTDAEFLNIFSTVLQDFVQQAGLIKRLVPIPVSSGTSSYTVPDYAMDAQEALYSERLIHRETGESLDQLAWMWRAKTGPPQQWHEDRLAPKTVQVFPTPTSTGYTVATAAAFYGTISSVADQTDISIGAAAPLYGTIASYVSAAYVETSGALLGTFNGFYTSSLNLLLVATAKPQNITPALDDLIECVPTSFVPYLKYGVLAKIFSQDSETKDVLRARYCEARYREGILLAQAVSQEVMDEVPGLNLRQLATALAGSASAGASTEL